MDAKEGSWRCIEMREKRLRRYELDVFCYAADASHRGFTSHPFGEWRGQSAAAPALHSAVNYCDAAARLLCPTPRCGRDDRARLWLCLRRSLLHDDGLLCRLLLKRLLRREDRRALLLHWLLHCGWLLRHYLLLRLLLYGELNDGRHGGGGEWGWGKRMELAR